MEYTVVGALVILIVAICESLKYAGLDSRYIPIISVVLGIIGALLFDGASFLTAVAGIIIGLATTGGYAVVKTSILNK